ncbi:MAG TPA: proline dehydrogenase family protein [Gaiellaceae bacterium]
MALLDRAVVRALPAVPRQLVRRLAAHYIAGPELDDAVRVVRNLNEQGKLATIDVLGEVVASRAEADAITKTYRDVLARVEAEQLEANISVKLTALGLELDEGLCKRNLEAVVEDARTRANFVRIDMEDSSTTDAALRLHRELRSAGHENVGVVLQSRLRRTLGDVPGLENVRLCKGIYLESEAVAFDDPVEVQTSFLYCLEALLDRRAYVAVATHDEELIRRALGLVRKHGLARDAYEFQMLYGVRAARGDELVRDGHRLRLYVPFGTHWYEYSLRRLQENPKIAGYVAADTLRRLRRRQL